MNITDKGSILIVSLFYLITLTSGYFIHESELIREKNEFSQLLVTINSYEINSENNSIVVYEDVGKPQPTKRVYNARSIVAISSMYKQRGYRLDYITEFLKKVGDQDVVVTRIWFSKKIK